MSTKKYLIYRKNDGLVLNHIVWDGVSPYPVDSDCNIEIVPAGSYAGIGWTRDVNGEYHPPVETEINEQESQS